MSSNDTNTTRLDDDQWLDGLLARVDPKNLCDTPRPSPAHDSLSIRGFDVLRLISRGGQGSVYEAVQNSTKRRVAIKLLHGFKSETERMLTRFQREIELAASLRYPNIATVFQSGRTEDGQHFYVMDYVDGSPLDIYFKERALSLPEILRQFAMVCDAVHYAHQRGVIHRDLKPSNILVDRDGTPFVVDFGLAKPIDNIEDSKVTLQHEILGTPAYMSPEQINGKVDQIGVQSDVYSLGVILYELLTGTAPYPVSGSLHDILHNITNLEPPPPSRRWSESGPKMGSSKTHRHCPINKELDTIVLRSLAKAPERRYQSAHELGQDIRYFLNGEPISARQDSSWYVLRKTARRYRAAIVATLLVFATLVGALVAVWREKTNAMLSLYSTSVMGAHREYDSHNIGLMHNLLELCPEEYRDWEWYLLKARADRSQDSKTFHEGIVNDLAISPDGNLLASAGADGTIALTDIEFEKPVQSIPAHVGNVWSVRFSPDGQQIVSTGALERV
jgi:serine/threonine protein kinase